MTDAIVNQIESQGNAYYRVKVSSREAQPKLWFARLAVERLDSGERVGGIQCSGDTQHQALLILSGKVRSCIDNLPCPPPEWGRIELRKLIADYRQFNDELTGILVALKKRLEANTLTAECLHDEYWKARDFSIEGSVMFARRLAQLSEQDRISLMTSADYIYQDQINPWSIDDMDSRSALFEFIVEPSEDVIKAHEVHEWHRGP